MEKLYDLKSKVPESVWKWVSERSDDELLQSVTEVSKMENALYLEMLPPKISDESSRQRGSNMDSNQSSSSSDSRSILSSYLGGNNLQHSIYSTYTVAHSERTSLSVSSELSKYDQWEFVNAANELNSKKYDSKTVPVSIERLYIPDMVVDGWALAVLVGMPGNAVKEVLKTDYRGAVQPRVSRLLVNLDSGQYYEVTSLNSETVLVNEMTLLDDLTVVAEAFASNKSLLTQGSAPTLSHAMLQTLAPCDFCCWSREPVCRCPRQLRLRRQPFRLKGKSFSDFARVFVSAFKKQFSVHMQRIGPDGAVENEQFFKLDTRAYYGNQYRLHQVKRFLLSLSPSQLYRPHRLLSFAHTSEDGALTIQSNSEENIMFTRKRPFDGATVELLDDSLVAGEQASDDSQTLAVMDVEHSASLRYIEAGSAAVDIENTEKAAESSLKKAKKLKENQKDSDSGPKLSLCSICGIQLPKGELRLHTKTQHDDSEDLSCQECGLTFGSRGNLNRHRRIAHLGIRQFRCSTCDKEFTSKDKLERHNQTKMHRENSCRAATDNKNIPV
eukprot:CAMPEP_0182443090 /NCGR_PEP_ID=MMETSP1172-20130603/1920_1 /TAXON_ID=708627 /ORGANISM="Timspurckia oligopyrenoides, Strain CCMP3278" /LENGTH=554 /DNA_ID=CAMNT_0024638257 /DNA_START=115 /DNA_END=1779 /DNA_ORIENTATION=-